MKFTTAASLSLLSAAGTLATSVEVAVIQANSGMAAASVQAVTTVAAVAAATHTVVVGGAKLEYNPPQIMANVGDVVMFMFMQKNHTATQSTFTQPCVKMAGGFDTGFMPNPNGTIPPPTMPFTVNTTAPIWMYCKQKMGTHCGSGMVFAINPTAQKSFDMFKAMAIAQNGTSSSTAAVTAAATSTAASVAGSAITLSVINGGGSASSASVAAVASSTAAAAMSQATSMVSGWNSNGNAQACTCACFCGVAAFPVGDGIGAFGGMPGSLPAPW